MKEIREWMSNIVVGQKHLKGKRQRRKVCMLKEKVNKLRRGRYENCSGSGGFHPHIRSINLLELPGTWRQTCSTCKQ